MNGRRVGGVGTAPCSGNSAFWDSLLVAVTCSSGSPDETLYIGHHIATMLYMTSCIMVGHGDLSVML
jgi:hypothetical protein